ncbi:hypothetical protein QM646_37475, partial [Rhodococcus erythropolis]|nr:hypothetical protein [Rhodococcus erythropolis]
VPTGLRSSSTGDWRVSVSTLVHARMRDRTGVWQPPTVDKIPLTTVVGVMSALAVAGERPTPAAAITEAAINPFVTDLRTFAM